MDYCIENEIIDFIGRRFSNEDKWRDGNCYWMAKILQERFGGSIYYMQIIGHYIVRINGDYYDWSGKLSSEQIDNDELILWDRLRYEDPLLYQHLIRDCVN